jgi:hypothetical protein
MVATKSAAISSRTNDPPDEARRCVTGLGCSNQLERGNGV